MNPARRRFLKVAGSTAMAGFAVDGLLVEPASVEFTHHDLVVPGGSGNRAIRFAQISDLHMHDILPLHAAIAVEVARRKPHFITITGDAVESRGGLAALDQFMRLLPRDVPKYAILGNWEHWGRVHNRTLRDLYGRHNGTLLINETAELWVVAARMLITGLDDAVGGYPSTEAALRGVEPSPHHIVLAHCPIQRDSVVRILPDLSGPGSLATQPYCITCVLSGHTHGGQVALGGWCPYLPEGSGDYVSGWYRGQRPWLYVSRGVGNSVLPVRIGSMPEVAFFTMRT